LAYHYRLCGWHLCSDLPVPELLPWPEPEGVARPADITLTEGEVPDTLEDNIGLNDFVKVDRKGTVLLNLANVVRFVVAGGRDVTVQMLTDTGRASWRLYFLGIILQYICHQRGAYPQHAASLCVGGRIVALAGHRGDGKSTLAFELVRRGHRLLSDDLTVLRSQGDEIQVFPAFPRLRLWRETLDAVGVGNEGLSRVRPGMEKFTLRPQDGFDPTPVKLDTVVVIADRAEIELKRCSPMAAVPLLSPYVCRPKVARLLGRGPDLLRFTGRIAVQSPIYHLKRPKQFHGLAEVAAAIEGLCR